MSDTRTSISSRDVTLDIVRVLATILVVEIHVFEIGYGTAPGSEIGSILLAVSHVVGRLGVPMFFILSGYLVMAKDYSNSESVGKFYREKVPALLATSTFWAVLYAALYSASEHADIWTTISWVLMLDAMPAGNWWFVPVIISLYLAIPLVSRALDGLDTKVLAVPVVVVFLWSFCIPAYNSIAAYFGLKTFSPQIVANYLLGAYGAYLVIGYVFRREGLLAIVPSVRGTTEICAAVVLLLVVFGVWTFELGYRYWYSSPLILIAGTALFILVYSIASRIRLSGKAAKVIAWLSKISFAVYFVHYILLRILRGAGVLAPGLIACGAAFLLVLLLSVTILGLLWRITAHCYQIRILIFHTI